MSAFTRRIGTALATLALLAVGATAQAEHHEKAEILPWDQAKVGELTQQLRKRASAAYDAVYRTQGTLGNVGAGQGHDFLRLKDSVRLAKTEARHLSNEVKDGKGRDETFHTFERLTETVRDIREIGARMFLDKSILDKFGAAGETLRALAPYYDPKLLEGGPKPLTGAGSK